MPASCPAARSAHARGEFGDSFFDTDNSRFRFFAGGNPADPFSACEWRDVVPDCLCFWRSGEGFSQIGWQAMSHTIILSNLLY